MYRSRQNEVKRIFLNDECDDKSMLFIMSKEGLTKNIFCKKKNYQPI